MIGTDIQKRETRDLWVAIAIALSLGVYHLLFNIISSVQYISYQYAHWVSNLLFFWILALLWVAYRRWRDALQRQKELRNILASISTEVIMVVDSRRRIQMVNESINIFGFSPEEVVKKTTDLLYLDRREDKDRPNEIRDSIDKIGFHIGQATGRKRTGETFPLEIMTASLKGREGVVVVIRDVTERKRADDALKKNQEELLKKNQELEESRKNIQITLERLGAAYEELKITQAKILQQEKMASIGQLAAGVAHEINNPMAFIASNLGTLDKYIRRLKDFIQEQSETIKSLKATDAIKQLDKKRKELKLDYTIGDIDLLVKESIDGSERVQKIVRELNLFSRVTDEEYKDANINECIESSINIVGSELKHKATLHKDYGNLPLTKCYPLKLNQVFINLLINAIQSIEKKGKIKIKTWEKDSSIWVTVSDTGCGIPQENQSKIFEPFFTTKEAGKGAGLGLSISYEIIQRHKGEISFESKKGKGTTFTIRIPIV